jgi:hypothetical protein
MKNLIFKIALPLTVISFWTITKWWYALPVDAPDTMFKGFPLIYVCPGWHTSLSLQIFVTELVVDFLIYFLFWIILISCIDRFLKRVKISRGVTIGMWALSGLFIAFETLFAANPDNIFYIKRPFEIQVLETGYEFIWQYTERPDYYKYFPKGK